tara:strand:- start:3370 stop:4182 length:813 start_codon:yes stop_codon:yes gene_type:complete
MKIETETALEKLISLGFTEENAKISLLLNNDDLADSLEFLIFQDKLENKIRKDIENKESTFIESSDEMPGLIDVENDESEESSEEESSEESSEEESSEEESSEEMPGLIKDDSIESLDLTDNEESESSKEELVVKFGPFGQYFKYNGKIIKLPKNVNSEMLADDDLLKIYEKHAKELDSLYKIEESESSEDEESDSSESSEDEDGEVITISGDYDNFVSIKKINGKWFFHCENGPALITHRYMRVYYLNGKKYPVAKWEKIVKLQKIINF